MTDADQTTRAGRTEATAPSAVVPGTDLIRLGDAHAEAGDWVGAVARWRAAAVAGAEPAASLRLRAFLRRFGGAGPGLGAGVARRALAPLAICAEAAVLGGLALFAADRPGGATDPVLLGLGWAGVAVSIGAALVFAARSGRLDGADATLPDAIALDELAARAEALASRLTTAGDRPEASSAGPGAVATP